MIKTILLGCLFVLILLASQQASAQVFTFTLTPASQCYVPNNTTGSAAITSSGVCTSFSWTVLSPPSSSPATYTVASANSDSININYTASCGIYTVICNGYTNGSPIPVQSYTMYPTLVCSTQPTVTIISSSASLCPGSSATLTASGASGYQWSPSSTTASSLVVTPTVSTCYTVTGYSPAGCTSIAASCVNVVPVTTPTIGVINSTVCAGSSAVLIAIGAGNYTWSPGAISGSSVTVTPTVSTCYTVTGISNSGCTSSVSSCVNVIANSIPTISVSSSTLCAGSSATLIASGAGSYTWSPGAISGNSIVISPTVNTCFTVTSSNASGCVSSTVSCLNILPAAYPVINTSSSSICFGSSFSATATGCNSYSWSTGATSAGIAVLPTTVNYFTFWVNGSNVNGCSASVFDSVFVNTNCSVVWPGDTNSDGVVDNTDVFEIGLSYGSTGPARGSASNAYTAQQAATWLGNGSTGKNQCHIDCTGNGVISHADTIAIFNNYLQTHSFKSSTSTTTDPGISFGTQTTAALAGEWNVFGIVLGSSGAPISQLYGVAFDVNFDNTLVEAGSAYLTYPASFLNASTLIQNVQFRKTNFAGGKIMAASVRTDGTDVNGTGVIAQLHLKLKTSSAANALQLSFSNPQKISAGGTLTPLNANPYTVNIIEAEPTGIRNNELLQSAVNVFPNPAHGQLTLQSSIAKEMFYSVSDLSGRELVKGVLVQSKVIDTNAFESGVYMIKFESCSNAIYKKLVIEK